MNEVVLLYIGAIIIFAWGAAHIAPVRGVVRGFGDLTTDNRRIITMTWVAEGIALCFVGALVFVTTFVCRADLTCARVVYISSIVMLVVSAAWTALTGARTRIVPMRICPVIKLVVAGLFLLGIVL